MQSKESTLAILKNELHVSSRLERIAPNPPHWLSYENNLGSKFKIENHDHFDKNQIIQVFRSTLKHNMQWEPRSRQCSSIY